MKTIMILIAACSIGLSVFAQSAEEKELATAVETLRKAMIDASKSTLENIATDDLSYGHSNGLVEDKATFVTSLTNGKAKFVSITLSDQTVKVAGNVGIVRNKFVAQMDRSGTPASVDIQVLMVWQKQKGQWKLVARQGFKTPEAHK